MKEDALKTYGLIGEDIANAFLSKIQNAVFDALGVNAFYMPFGLRREDLTDSLQLLKSDFAGFNVADPYKRALVKHMDELDDTARATQTVNAVKCENGKLYGFNTDTRGFLDSLIGLKINFFDKDILLMGAGGTAAAIAHALLDKGAFLTVVTRDYARALAFKEELQVLHNKNRIRVLRGVLPHERFFGVVNAASVELEEKFSGMALHDETLRGAGFVYEFYAGEKSALLKKAAGYGIAGKNGLDMLFYSALGAQKIWLGEETYERLNVPALEGIKEQIIGG